EAAELIEVGDPPIADRAGNDIREIWVREQKPTSGRDTVGFVVEALRENARQILDRGFAQQIGMDRRDTVGTMRSDNREVRHTNLAAAGFVDETDALNQVLVAGDAEADRVEQAAIDLVDDLEVSRQRLLKPRD